MSPKWKWYLPGYILALPHTLVGILIALVFYRCHSWRWSDGCLECIGGTNSEGRSRIWGRPMAQTHGWLIISEDRYAQLDIDIRVHERVHVVQGFIGGPLYVLAYGAHFLYTFARGGGKDWYATYAANPFERQAYATRRKHGDYAGAWGSGPV